MSYILDALKKAEAERRMGTAPESRAAAGAPRYQPGAPSARPLRLIVVVLLALLAGAGIGFAWQTWHRAPTAAPRATSARPQAATAPAPAAPAATAQAAPKAVETPPPVARAETSPPSAPTEQRPVLRHVRPPAPVRHSTSPAPAAQRAAAAAPPRAEAAAVVPLQQLPAEIRSRIPPLATSGYLYSGNPADRSVVLNGRLLREGDRVAPQLTLEQLLPDGMILNYDGHRFRTAY